MTPSQVARVLGKIEAMAQAFELLGARTKEDRDREEYDACAEAARDCAKILKQAAKTARRKAP